MKIRNLIIQLGAILLTSSSLSAISLPAVSFEVVGVEYGTPGSYECYYEDNVVFRNNEQLESIQLNNEQITHCSFDYIYFLDRNKVIKIVDSARRSTGYYDEYIKEKRRNEAIRKIQSLLETERGFLSKNVRFMDVDQMSISKGGNKSDRAASTDGNGVVLIGDKYYSDDAIGIYNAINAKVDGNLIDNYNDLGTDDLVDLIDLIGNNICKDVCEEGELYLAGSCVSDYKCGQNYKYDIIDNECKYDETSVMPKTAPFPDKVLVMGCSSSEVALPGNTCEKTIHETAPRVYEGNCVDPTAIFASYSGLCYKDFMSDSVTFTQNESFCISKGGYGISYSNIRMTGSKRSTAFDLFWTTRNGSSAYAYVSDGTRLLYANKGDSHEPRCQFLAENVVLTRPCSPGYTPHATVTGACFQKTIIPFHEVLVQPDCGEGRENIFDFQTEEESCAFPDTKSSVCSGGFENEANTGCERAVTCNK